MFHTTRKNRRSYFYVLTAADEKNRFLTLTDTKEEALEYAEMLMKVTHIEHYKMWAKVHDLNPEDDSNWSTYYDTCISDDEKDKYSITNISYKQKDLAAILRMFTGCLPLGCSFDQQSEYVFFKQTMDVINKAQKSIDTNTAAEQLEKMKNDQIDEDIADVD